MAIGECGAVLVECELAISHGAIGKVLKVEVARLLWLSLLFEVSRIHDCNQDQSLCSQKLCTR
jgi:hypothetical protein